MMTHKNLDVWKMSIDFVKEVYGVTRSFPKDEVYGMTNQLRRASVSVPTNIAEGAAKSSIKDYIRYLYISLGSLSEIETLLIISDELKFAKTDKLLYYVIQIRKKLLNLIRYQKTKLV